MRNAPSDTVEQLIEDALAGIRAIERELDDAAIGLAARTTEADERYTAALEAAERVDVWGTDNRVAEALAGLGVDDIPFDRRLDEVSGGQRSRLALAALLLGRPTALLLDEPTNHLDDAATAYLRSQLTAWPGPGGVRESRPRVPRRGRHVAARHRPVAVGRHPVQSGRALAAQPHTYTDYLAAKAAERLRWQQQFAAETKELAHLEHTAAVTAREIENDKPRRDNDKFLFDFKAGNIARQVSRRVRNAEVRIEVLERDRVDEPTPVLSFAGIPHGSHALRRRRADHLGAGCPARAAASTSSRSRSGRATDCSSPEPTAPASRPCSGCWRAASPPTRARSRGGRGCASPCSSRTCGSPSPAAPPTATYLATLGERRAEAIPLADLGLLGPSELDRPVGQLSVGQQRRLALALIIAKPPHVFLLDEPTNHLSLTLATELEDALGRVPGRGCGGEP